MPASDQADIVLLDSHWPRRALLRAQLIEEGYQVAAAEDWPTAKSYAQALQKPRLVIVDLQGQDDARSVLDDLQALMPPDRVLILMALGTTTAEQVRERGFHALARPAEVRDVLKKVADLCSRKP